MSKRLEKTLNRNKYKIDHLEGKLQISSEGTTSNSLLMYMIFGIALLILGIVILALGSFWGIVFLVSGIPMLIQASRFTSQQKDLSDRVVYIYPDKIEVTGESGIKYTTFSNIQNIRYRFETSSNLSTAVIFLICKEMEIDVIQIFNADKRDLDHDAQDIVNELKVIVGL